MAIIANPVSVGNRTRKSDYDALYDNVVHADTGGTPGGAQTIPGVKTFSSSPIITLGSASLTVNATTGNPLVNYQENGSTIWTTGYNTASNYFTISKFGVADHFVITDAGRFGFGTATPIAKLEAVTSADSYVAIFQSTHATEGYGVKIIAGNDAGDFSLTVNNRPETANLFVVKGNGQIGLGLATVNYQLHLSTDSAAKLTTNTWTTTSDKRLKTKIVLADLDRCWNLVKTIPLKHYKWREDVFTDEEVIDRSQLGWLSQDVEADFPRSISHYKKKISKDEVIDDCQGLNADQIYKSMYGALQLAIQKIERLELTTERA